jgi:AAA+ ATPase superfamily predicted ATPase
MIFLDRAEELARLLRLSRRREGSLAVVYGRRRIGKTRLLVEWVERTGGVYAVADQSSPEIQREYLSRALALRLPGFADARFPDWRGLLSHVAREAQRERWRGPVILDELPYLVLASPELPSVLQHFVDHEGRRAGLCLTVAGSSQRMMQGLVLSESAPLFGRASEILALGPLPPATLIEAFGGLSGSGAAEQWAAWGGVPRYWELAAELDGPAPARVDELVLSPLGPLHREPDHLLLEEIPSALEVRPVLDAIGAGVHRLSEIAGRMGKPATSLARPLERLRAMGLVRREVPFGDSESRSKRSLYRLADPFFRLWFRVVAPNRGLLATGSAASRRALLAKYWPALVAESWEELCREMIPHLSMGGRLGRLGPWKPAFRWWSGTDPEWDIVAESASSNKLLLGEVKFAFRKFGKAELARETARLAARPLPRLPEAYGGHTVVRALFVPEADTWTGRECIVVTSRDVFGRSSQRR